MIDAIVQEITIEASANRIFDAISSPHERVKWWGMKDVFQATQMESDLRPGGEWSMRGYRSGTKPFIVSGRYRAVERPTLLEFTWLPDWHPNESLVKIELEEIGSETRVKVTHSGFATEEEKGNFRGWHKILGWLRDYSEHPPDAGFLGR